MNRQVLIVDDEKNLTLVLSEILKNEGIPSKCINESIHLNKEELLDYNYGAVLLDLFMPDYNGMELLKEIKKLRPHLPVIIMTAFGTIELAVLALKEGAFDFITKPFDQEDLITIIQKALRTYEASQKEVSFLKYEDGLELLFTRDLLKKTDHLFKVEAPVLIEGENGLGRDSFAFEIHKKSKRGLRPFVKINAQALSEALLDKELFGYQYGTFIGTLDTKPGKIELAHSGTLFIDEIQALSPDLQLKLLKVVRDQSVERMGSAHSTWVDVRFIVGTAQNLENEMIEERFHSELYFQLSQFSIQLEPIRKRSHDISILLDYFNEILSKKYLKEKVIFSEKIVKTLTRYSWPGNLRQIENFVGQMLHFYEGQELLESHLPNEILAEKDETQILSDFKEHVKNETQKVETNLIKKALHVTSGNITKAAHTLGLSRKGLQLKMKDLGLRKESSE